MARQRLRLLSLSLVSSALLSLASCSPEIPEGHFSCAEASDCPNEWFCWSNGRCYSTPELSGGDGSIPGGDAGPMRDASPGDASPRDAEPADARPGDARVDGGPGEDGALPPDDAGPDDDAGPGDGDIPDGGCVTNFGEVCDAPDRCGARVSCTGECVGGDPAPACACASLACDPTSGTWSICPDPANLGADCSDPQTCGGQIDCSGQCSGGSGPPSCACAAAICDPTGVWFCPGPSNLGDRCDTMTVCDGQIDCNGECVGGRPPDPCECGTPTCGGCVGGTCGANSQCVNGSCQCTVNDCSCPATGPSTCAICRANGNVGSCNVDAYACGAFGSAGQICDYGCVDGPPPACACHPQTGGSCFGESCDCFCGTFFNFGTTQCDGSCLPGYPTCGELCFDTCGVCPFPPCPL